MILLFLINISMILLFLINISMILLFFIDISMIVLFFIDISMILLFLIDISMILLFYSKITHAPPHLSLNYLNSRHSNINFTMEIEQNRQLPFLDTLVKHNPITFFLPPFIGSLPFPVLV